VVMSDVKICVLKHGSFTLTERLLLESHLFSPELWIVMQADTVMV